MRDNFTNEKVAIVLPNYNSATYLEETILEVPLDILNSWRYPIQPNGVNIRLR